MKRRSLCGVDATGKPRGTFTAEELLARLDRSESDWAMLAASTAEDVWASRMEERKKDLCRVEGQRPMPTEYNNNQERTMMQALTIGLELNTSHTPSLRVTFPWLLKWIRSALRYVHELEDGTEKLEAELVRVHKVATAKAKRDATRIGALERDAKALSAEVDELRRIYGELSNSFESTTAGSAVLEAQRDAWKVAAQSSAMALSCLMRAAGVAVEVPDTMEEIATVTQEATPTGIAVRNAAEVQK